MTIRPILFSGPMIRALLEGRKTQTRRVISFDGVEEVIDFVRVAFDEQGRPVYEMKDGAGQHISRPIGGGLADFQYSPNYAVGDLLWVREAWRTPESLDHLSPKQIEDHILDLGYHGIWCPRVTEADNLAHQWSEEDGFREDEPAGRLRAGMHMPRWASRLTLKVTDVRVQRVQQISEGDSFAEGIQRAPAEDDPLFSGRRCFQHLWDSLNEKRGYGWDKNPWVIVVDFVTIRKNINEVVNEQAN